MTDDWMDDGEALGSMDSEEEDDSVKSEEKPVVKEAAKPQNATGIALPITEMTDDWMDDTAVMGSTFFWEG